MSEDNANPSLPVPPDFNLEGSVRDALAGAIAQVDFLNSLPEGIREPVAVFQPAIARMAAEDFWLFVTAMAGNAPAQAASIARKNMNAEELVAEKAKLAQLTKIMATDRIQARKIGEYLLYTVLNAAFKAALMV